MHTIFEVSKRRKHPMGEAICTVTYALHDALTYRAEVPCSTIGRYRVGDEFTSPMEPDIAGAVDELRKAVEDLVLVVRECPGRPDVPGLPPAYQRAIDHLAIVRHKLGVNR